LTKLSLQDCGVLLKHSVEERVAQRWLQIHSPWAVKVS